MVDLTDKFIAWGKQNAIAFNLEAELDDFSDLKPFEGLIGDAQVVTLGESHHYTREYNRFRFRLFRYLVTEMDFKVFVHEIGFPETKPAYDYVNLTHDDTQAAYLSVNQTFGFWAQQQEMLDWIRAYNEKQPEQERIRFYGMDGSQIWQHSGTAVESVCQYLDRVDPDHAQEVRGGLLPLSHAVTEGSLEDGDRDEVEANLHQLNYGVTKLWGRLLANRMPYADKSSQHEFEWALGSVEVAQQIVTNLIQVHETPDASLHAWNNMRDYFMARQLKWIVDHVGPDRRILVAAHNTHLQTCEALEGDIPMCAMGQYFRTMIPEGAMFNIGGTANYSLRPNDPSIPESNQGVLAKIGLECFLLDLRPAAQSDELRDWLAVQRPDRSNVNYQPVAMGEAYDAIFYVERLSVDELRLPEALQVDTVALSESELDALTGKYVFGSGGWTEELYITREGTRLYSDIGENCDEFFPMYKSELFPASNTEFRWQEWPMELIFELGEDGKAKGVAVKVPCMDESMQGYRA